MSKKGKETQEEERAKFCAEDVSYLEIELAVEGYNEFTEVSYRNREMRIHCTNCGESITVTDWDNLLGGFKQHLLSEEHFRGKPTFNNNALFDNIQKNELFVEMGESVQPVGQTSQTRPASRGKVTEGVYKPRDSAPVFRKPHDRGGSVFGKPHDWDKATDKPNSVQSVGKPNCRPKVVSKPQGMGQVIEKSQVKSGITDNRHEQKTDKFEQHKKTGMGSKDVSYLEIELAFEGYADFTDVSLRNRDLSICCKICGKDIANTNRENLLEDFREHLETNEHLRNSGKQQKKNPPMLKNIHVQSNDNIPTAQDDVAVGGQTNDLTERHPITATKGAEVINEARYVAPPPPPVRDFTLMTSHIPKHWDIDATNDDTTVKYVRVNNSGTTAAEFQSVELRFKATMPNSQIISLERVQNMEIFDAFDRKRNWMRKRNKMDAIDLFHGTAEANIKAICEQGFDWRISGSAHGVAFGRGVYFGATAQMSSGYVQGSTGADRSMLICKVLVGEFCQGNPAYVRPPPKDPNRPKANFYDSCVNNVANPQMFIIFERDQAYPEYIIKYR